MCWWLGFQAQLCHGLAVARYVHWRTAMGRQFFVLSLACLQDGGTQNSRVSRLQLVNVGVC
jgi:hypothetical protein